MTLQPEHIPQLFAGLCTGAVFAAVAVDFLYFNRRKDVRFARRSIVATGTMTGFFLLYYIVLVRKWCVVNTESAELAAVLLWAGAAMVAAGAGVNILSRFILKDNWANHIKIYADHTLVKTGVYRKIRHPLYASLMLMLFGGALMYRNALCALLTACVFIPFMAYRAKQEEALLSERFLDYAEYKKQAGMFLPVFRRK